MIHQSPTSWNQQTAPDGLETFERVVLAALSHHVVDGRQLEPVSIGAIIMQAAASSAGVLEGVNKLRYRGWIVCTGALHLDHEDRCLLMGEGLARAAVLAAKRELAMFEVQVGGGSYLISYEQRPGASPSRTWWTARAFRIETAGSPPVMVAEGVTREAARDALVDHLAASTSPREDSSSLQRDEG